MHNFRGRILWWFKVFLSDRRQCVVIRDGAQFWSDVTSGVPLGSVLGINYVFRNLKIYL